MDTGGIQLAGMTESQSSQTDNVTSFLRGVGNLWGDGKGRILFTVSSGWFLLFGVLMIYPILLPHLRDAYGFDLRVAGVLLATLWAANAIGNLPGGVLADRWAERTVLVVAMAIAGVGLVLVIFGSSTFLLFAGTVVLGLGAALYPIARITILSDLYPNQTGAALGITMAAGDIGQSLLPPLAGLIAVTFAWQYGFGFIIPFFLIGTLALWFVVPSPVGESTTGSSTSDESVRTAVLYLLSEIRNPSITAITGVLILYAFIWQAFSGFYPTYLMEIKGFSPAVASGLFGLYFAMGVVIKPLAGRAFDQLGTRSSLMMLATPSAIALGALPVVDGLGPIIVMTILTSFLLGSGAITQAYLADVLPDNIRGTGLGTLRTTSFLISATSPALFGIVADIGFFDEGFLVLSGLAVLMFLLAFLVPERMQ